MEYQGKRMMEQYSIQYPTEVSAEQQKESTIEISGKDQKQDNQNAKTSLLIQNDGHCIVEQIIVSPKHLKTKIINDIFGSAVQPDEPATKVKEAISPSQLYPINNFQNDLKDKYVDHIVEPLYGSDIFEKIASVNPNSARRKAVEFLKPKYDESIKILNKLPQHPPIIYTHKMRVYKMFDPIFTKKQQSERLESLKS